MAKEIYLSLEKQKEREHMFNYALVYRGTDNPETACTVEAELDDFGKYVFSFVNSEGEIFNVETEPKSSKSRSVQFAKSVLEEQAEYISSLLGCKFDLEDRTQ